MSVMAKWLDGSRYDLVRRYASAQATLYLRKGAQQTPTFRPTVLARIPQARILSITRIVDWAVRGGRLAWQSYRIIATCLQAHDALVILKNSLTIQKLLYLLRTSECAGNPLLRRFDDTLRTGLINILNIDLNDDQWLQASLPVGDGGLGIRSAEMLAPSALLASAASTPWLQQSILPDSTWVLGDQSVQTAKSL